MPIFTRLETEIRELHEDDTAVENRLVRATAEAQAAYERIAADGRIDAAVVPDILRVLQLVPAIHADAQVSRRYNLQTNNRYQRLASQRSQWARRSHDDDDPEPVALELAA